MDKRMSPAEIVGQLEDGMTIGIGGLLGECPRRKPMALIRAARCGKLRSDLSTVSIGFL